MRHSNTSIAKPLGMMTAGLMALAFATQAMAQDKAAPPGDAAKPAEKAASKAATSAEKGKDGAEKAAKKPRVIKGKRARIKGKKLRPVGERIKAAKAARARRNKYPHRRPKIFAESLKVPEVGKIPFEEGERLVFKVRMLNAEALDVMLGVGKRVKSKSGSMVVTLKGWLKSSDFLSKFYPVNDELTTSVYEDTFLPLRTDFRINENGKNMRYVSIFDQKEEEVRSARTKKGSDRELRRKHYAVAPLYDGLSMMYALRRMELKPGMKFSFYGWDGRRERLVDVEVEGQERVWTPAGWFETMKVNLKTRITGGFIKKPDLDKPMQKGTIWIGLDPHRTPVKLSSPTKLGDASAVLVKQYKEKV